MKPGAPPAQNRKQQLSDWVLTREPVCVRVISLREVIPLEPRFRES